MTSWKDVKNAIISLGDSLFTHPNEEVMHQNYHIEEFKKHAEFVINEVLHEKARTVLVLYDYSPQLDTFHVNIRAKWPGHVWNTTHGVDLWNTTHGVDLYPKGTDRIDGDDRAKCKIKYYRLGRGDADFRGCDFDIIVAPPDPVQVNWGHFLTPRGRIVGR